MTMANTCFSAVPVIDISPLIRNGAGSAPAVVEQIGRAARDVGFFSVVGHGCPPTAMAALQRQAVAFFEQSLERKMAVYIGLSSNHRGYVPAGEEVFAGGSQDRKEAFDSALDLPTDDPDARRVPLLGPNLWPDLPGFAADVSRYYSQILAIGRRLMSAFSLALGLAEDHFNRWLIKPPSQLRLIHYPYNADAHDEVGIGAHSDYECFTLLFATSPGLEIMNSAGQWIDSPPVEGGLTINIGDLLELLSGGAFVATSHRVRRVSQERYSFPLFFNLDYDAPVAPIHSTTETAPVLAGEHLYAQTIQTFRYLQDRLARGEVSLPSGSRAPASFGREARQEPGIR